ncbi:MAG TPA: diaminopimelate decarboxylase [Nitrosomonas sp.]|uniref:diaminopimelate decarboxylase n=1 Tax=Nitrosomonas sp. TaxID=42353 RepID=UPI002083A8BF|nr:diaminopimelate decarboxylase [Nitrosomonas sp.]GJL75532.1 MAG: diaminopimelate decarboxylase [Nitrosomonas sp.]HNP27177.1 diaminopimelate decarboxylase [Nitrosomonas sp.]
MSDFPHFDYQQNALHVESVPLETIASKFGTPCYVYSRAALTATYHAFEQAFADDDFLICYAVKANSNLAILNLLARLGSGFDIVSGGELQRVIKAGGDPRKTVFSGVGKLADEMRMALATEILCFNVESAAELQLLNQIAAVMNKVAPVSLRVNPDVDAKTHPYISTGLKENKFGIPLKEAEQIYLSADQFPHIRFTGLDCHIGSQLTELDPFTQAGEKLVSLLQRLKSGNQQITHLDLGGGLGIRYSTETPPSIQTYVNALRKTLVPNKIRLLIEPGRSLAGNAGLLLTRTIYLKHTPDRHFAIVDAAMNDLMRPSLYNAYHEILPVVKRNGAKCNYQVVGPVCETGDFLGHDRKFSLEADDLLAVMSAGAYGTSMSSNYNTRPRAAEVMVDGDTVHLIRARETIDQLTASETILPA